MKTMEKEAIPSAAISSYQELLNVNQINQAVIQDKSVLEIAKIYLDIILSSFGIKHCRFYILNGLNQLELVVENSDKIGYEIIEQKIGTKINNIIPTLSEGNYLYQLMQKLQPIITCDPKQIKMIVEAHTEVTVLKAVSRWAVNVLGLKTFGVIPLSTNEKIVGLVTFSSKKVFTDPEKENLLRFTRLTSEGLVKKITDESIIEQKNLANNIFDILPVDIAILDKNNRYSFVNKSAIRNDSIREWIIGKTDEEYCNKFGKDQSLAENRIKNLKTAEKTGQTLQWIEHLVDKDANPLHFLRILKPIYVNHHRYKIGYGLDVSELINTQKKLKETQRIGKLGSWELNLNTGKILFGEEISDVLEPEYLNDGISIKKFYHKIHSKYRTAFIQSIRGIYQSNKIENLEIALISKTGETTHFSLNAEAVIDDDKVVKKIMGTFFDITERKKYEEKLKSNHALLLTSEAMGKIGSWEVNFVDMNDWSKNTTRWSDESYRIFGYEPGSVEVSFPFFLQHVHPDDKHLISLNFSELFVPGAHHEAEFRIILNNGTIKHLQGKFYIQFDEKNIPTKMVGMTQDITDRKRLEQKLENYNQKLKEEIETQTMELSIANKNLDAFNYSISHDIRTPLRAMDMYIHLLREQVESDEESLDYVKKLQMSVNEMKDMISSLLDFSKFSTAELKKETVDMNFKIRHCIDLLTKDDRDNKIEFKILNTPLINADKILIKNVLCNLIGNAIKYSSKKTKSIIEISGTCTETHTTYYIKDNGDGFDEKFKSKLFKPFSRLHNNSEFEGNGAGLAIVEKIISRHGGTIWAEAKKGEGATFYFKLPNS